MIGWVEPGKASKDQLVDAREIEHAIVRVKEVGSFELVIVWPGVDSDQVMMIDSVTLSRRKPFASHSLVSLVPAPDIEAGDHTI